MLDYLEVGRLLEERPELLEPREFTLACGHRVPNEIGVPVWNFYDMVPSSVRDVVRRSVVRSDTSGALPDGITYWVFAGSVDCSRVCCEACGVRS